MSHCISHVVAARTLYSASVEDLEIVGCFFEHQDMRESPKNMQNPVMDLLVSGQAAQSESVKAFSCKVDVAGKNRPKVGQLLTYLKTLMAAS